MKKPLQRKQLMSYCLAAALPLLLMAVIFNFSLVFDDRFIFWTNQEILGYIIQAEFLAVASGVLIILPLLIQIKTRFIRIIRMAIFITVASVFAWVAYNIDGLEGMLFYALLVFVTYGGGTLFIFDLYTGASRAFLSLLRWSAGVFIYFTLQLTFELDSDIGNWKNTREVIPFGAAYFYLLFMLELVLYPFLTFYLEKRHAEDRVLMAEIKQAPSA